jgi:hypothetical protein
MAELGALANLAAIVGASFQIDSVLIDIGTALGSAGDDIRALGDEVSSYHNILKNVQHALLTARSFRSSLDELPAAQDILDQSSKIFAELEDLLNGLYSQQRVTNVARIKWALKRNRVSLMHKKIRNFSGKLQFMLVIMTFTTTLTYSGLPQYSESDLSVRSTASGYATHDYRKVADSQDSTIYSSQEHVTIDGEWDSCVNTVSKIGHLSRFPSMNFDAVHSLRASLETAPNPGLSCVAIAGIEPGWPVPYELGSPDTAWSMKEPAVYVAAYPTPSYAFDGMNTDHANRSNSTVTDPQNTPAPFQRNGWYNIFESKEDSYQNVIVAALESQGAGLDWRQWRCYLVCGRQERRLDYLESRQLVLAEMGFEGKPANLMLRHRNDERIEECTGF